jgi:hypothetical protein
MGSKGVFGVLLIGLGILGAYLAITGQLQTIWTGISTGIWKTAPTAAAPPTPVNTANAATNPNTTAAQAAIPTVAPQLPSTTAAQIQNQLQAIQNLLNYEPQAVLPASSTTTPSATISSLPSVYSTTLAQQSGVTGIVS